MQRYGKFGGFPFHGALFGLVTVFTSTKCMNSADVFVW